MVLALYQSPEIAVWGGEGETAIAKLIHPNFSHILSSASVNAIAIPRQIIHPIGIQRHPQAARTRLLMHRW